MERRVQEGSGGRKGRVEIKLCLNVKKFLLGPEGVIYHDAEPVLPQCDPVEGLINRNIVHSC